MAKDYSIKKYSKEPRPVISIDYERYEHYLEDSDLSPEQKRAFIDSLWDSVPWRGV